MRNSSPFVKSCSLHWTDTVTEKNDNFHTNRYSRSQCYFISEDKKQTIPTTVVFKMRRPVSLLES